VNYTSEYITEEPDAVVPHVRICVGAVQVTGRSTMTKSLRKYMRNSKTLNIIIFVFIAAMAGCSDSKDDVQETNRWDQSTTNWDNTKWN